MALPRFQRFVVIAFVKKYSKFNRGFIDGTENVAEVKDRRAAALLPTGGSYVIHQRWIHDLPKLHGKPIESQEQAIGRYKADR